MSTANAKKVDPDERINAMASMLVARLGRSAAGDLAERANNLARQGRWPEHAMTLRMLTVVEHQLEPNR